MRGRRTGKLREAAAAFFAKQEAAPANAFLAALAARGNQSHLEIWPENWQAYLLFTSLQTQWNVGGMGGRTGLRYEALYPLLDRQTDTPEQWQQLFDDVRVMEYAALSQMADDAAD